LLEELGMEVKRGREEIGKGKEWVVLVSSTHLAPNFYLGSAALQLG